MKCLENLSLVDDECLDALQKDIEELIASYIDIEQVCYDILDNILSAKLNTSLIKEVFNIFHEVSEMLYGDSCFDVKPVYVTKIEELSKVLIKKSWIETKEDATEYGIWFAKEYSDEINHINNGYWFYRDGTNGEAFLQTTKKAFDYLKCIINWCDKKEQVIIHSRLKELIKYNEI